MQIKKIVAYVSVIIGVVLLGINGYGLTVSVAPTGFTEENLRFNNDQTLNYEAALASVNWLDSDDVTSYAGRINDAIAQRLAHVHWKKYPPGKFNQRIPLSENFILFAMAFVTDIPEYERYHFANPYRSLERGIGICGDASMIMSQLLDHKEIDNKIITFPGHVVVSVNKSPGQTWLYDPDFNVILPYSVEQINAKPSLIEPFYYEKGYSEKEVTNLVNKYGLDFKVWDGVSHFITNKYYFEKVSYWLKWVLPLTLLFFGIYLLRR